MTVTEAAACGTPAVVTRIAGHTDAVAEGKSGLLADGPRRAARRAGPGALGRGAAGAARGRGARRTRRSSRGPRPRAGPSRCWPPRRCCGAATRDPPPAAGEPTGVTESSVAGDLATRVDRVPPRTRRGIGYAALALLAYVPLLLTAPGKVAADTKQYLYLDPGRLMERAWSMWDPNIGFGHGHPPEHRLPVPDGPLLLGARPRSACPTGSRSGSGSARILLFAGLGMLYLLRTLGPAWPGRARRRARVHAEPVPRSTTRRGSR